MPVSDSLYPHSTALALRMGSGTSIPLASPLGCILRNWKEFDPDNLKKKGLIFFCNTAWSQYKLGDQGQWPLNGTLNYITILPGKGFRGAVGPGLHGPQSESEPEGIRRGCLSIATFMPRPPPSPPPASLTRPSPSPPPPGILDEPPCPRSHQPPQPSASQRPPPYPEADLPSPPHARSRAAQLSESSPNTLPLQDVANRDLGAIRAQGPFPVSDLSPIQGKLGSFSQDSSTFIREFQAVTIALDLTWPDCSVVLTTCCITRKRPGSVPWLRLVAFCREVARVRGRRREKRRNAARITHVGDISGLCKGCPAHSRSPEPLCQRRSVRIPADLCNLGTFADLTTESWEWPLFVTSPRYKC